MTAVDDIRALGELRAGAERALRLAKAHHEADLEDLEWWRDRALAAEQELRELRAEVEASTRVDLLRRYRRVCAEKAILVQQLATANVRGGVR